MFRRNPRRGAGSSSSQNTAQNTLNKDAARIVARYKSYMSIQEIKELAHTTKSNYQFFQPILNNAKQAHPLLIAVVEANPVELVRLVRANPELLFQKGQVKDPAGQRFYNVSPYQLMTFLGDASMKQEIMPLVMPMTKNMEKIRSTQYEEIDSGGPDLVKMAEDPTRLDFDALLHHKETHHPYEGLIPEIPQIHATFPLLENPDGLLYYKEPGDAGNVHLYYANRTTQTVEEVYPASLSKTDKAALNDLLTSMDSMETNSSKRSSNEEHRLIASVLRHPNSNRPLFLHRKGIQYDDCEGVRYCDYRIDFNRYYNTNKQCIRFFTELNWPEGGRSWIELGQRQREVMWRLQFVLSTSPFYNRDFTFYNENTNEVDVIFDAGGLAPGLGSEFTVDRGELHVGSLAFLLWSSGERVKGHMLEVCNMVEDAKSAVAESKPEQDWYPQNAGPNP